MNRRKVKDPLKAEENGPYDGLWDTGGYDSL